MERVWTRIYPERTQVQGNTRRGQAARKNDENREVSGTLTRATSATCDTRCSPGPVAAGSREMEVGSKRSLRTRSPSGRRRSQCRKTGAVLQRARLPRAFRPGSNSQLPHKATLINFLSSSSIFRQFSYHPPQKHSSLFPCITAGHAAGRHSLLHVHPGTRFLSYKTGLLTLVISVLLTASMAISPLADSRGGSCT